MLPLTQLTAAPAGPITAETAAVAGEKAAQNQRFSSILANHDMHMPDSSGGLAQTEDDLLLSEPASALLPETGKDLPGEATGGLVTQPATNASLMAALPIVATNVSASLDAGSEQPTNAPTKPGTPLAPSAPAPDQVAVPDAALVPMDEARRSSAPLRDLPRQVMPGQPGMSLRLRTESAIERVASRSLSLELPLADNPIVLGSNNPTAVATGSPAGPMVQPLPSILGAPAVERPQDFAQLIDRLAAAREASQAQAVTVALAHAEFGKVELRFGNDATGLSVTMSSADPDFARAVHAAVPPVSATTDAGSTQPRSSGGGPGSDQASAQAGTGSGEHRGNRSNPSSNHTLAANPGGARRDQSDHGIFA